MAKKTGPMTLPAGPRRLGRLSVLRLTAYYVMAGLVLVLLTSLFPQNPVAPAGAAPTGMKEGLEWFRWKLAVLPAGAPRAVDACVQMAAALILVLPLAFAYVRTRTRLKYDRSLIPTVVMLPIVITAILVVVQDSLALAFSLAGIVAAVRFRNTLREAGDAVYIFGSIGIGFAAGIHAIDVAAALSLCFVALELALWKINFGDEFDNAFTRLCLPSGADLVAAPDAAGDVPVRREANGRKQHGDVETDPRSVVLRIYVQEAASARPAIERILARDAKRWLATGGDGTSEDSGVLEYRVRPRKSVGIEALRDHLLAEGAPHVIAADEAAPAHRF